MLEEVSGYFLAKRSIKNSSNIPETVHAHTIVRVVAVARFELASLA